MNFYCVEWKSVYTCQKLIAGRCCCCWCYDCRSVAHTYYTCIEFEMKRSQATLFPASFVLIFAVVFIDSADTPHFTMLTNSRFYLLYSFCSLHFLTQYCLSFLLVFFSSPSHSVQAI